MPTSLIRRYKTYSVSVRYKNSDVKIGGGAPVVIQSMTNTDTSDVESTVNQIVELTQAGSELVRLTVNAPNAAQAVPQIRARLDDMGIYVPLIGDFHYNGHTLLSEFPECAKSLSKYRINPGNVGHGAKRATQFAQMIEIARRYEKPVRIGVNWGSLDQELLARIMDENTRNKKPLTPKEVMYEALITSALESARVAEDLGLTSNKIVLSCKVSDVQDLINVYRRLSERCDYPLHLGLTEAGMGSKGIVASTAAMAVLLQDGIGDAIRVSLTPAPNGSRADEVVVAQEILQTMGLRRFMPMVTSCPGCGRTASKRFQDLADNVQTYLRKQMPKWKNDYSGVENMTVAVMGCVVNGPGESKHANIGVSLPGSGESSSVPVFVDGEKKYTLLGENIAEQFQTILNDYVKAHYGNAA